MPIVFSPALARRIGNATRSMEALQASEARQRPSRSAPTDWLLHFVRLTDAEPVEGRYPGVWLEHDPVAEWEERAPVWIVAANGEALQTGTVYLARQTGEAAVEDDTRPVLCVASDSEVAVARITSTTQSSGRYPGVLTKHDPAANTWSDGAAVWISGINSETLALNTRYLCQRTGEATISGSKRPALVAVRPAGGIQSLNGLTATAQFLVVGTAGNDFNIVSSTATHTFNLPSASQTARGVVNLSDQRLGRGRKTVEELRVLPPDEQSFHMHTQLSRTFVAIAGGNPVEAFWNDGLILKDARPFSATGNCDFAVGGDIHFPGTLNTVSGLEDLSFQNGDYWKLRGSGWYRLEFRSGLGWAQLNPGSLVFDGSTVQGVYPIFEVWREAAIGQMSFDNDPHSSDNEREGDISQHSMLGMIVAGRRFGIKSSSGGAHTIISGKHGSFLGLTIRGGIITNIPGDGGGVIPTSSGGTGTSAVPAGGMTMLGDGDGSYMPVVGGPILGAYGGW